ncbi:MAG: HAMP domain-containing protein [Chloroflexi bacterium]|nr:HAMP domain-containing protein [Chloroflexota bacterium]
MSLPAAREETGDRYDASRSGWISISRLRGSLQARLLAAFLAVSLIPLLILGVTGNSLAENAFSEDATATLRGAVASQRGRIEAFLAQSHEQLGQISSATQIEISLRRFLANGDQESRLVMAQILQDLVESAGNLEIVDIQAKSGEVVASSDPARIGTVTLGGDELKRALDGSLFDHFSDIGEDHPALLISSPVRFDGTAIGLTTMHVSGERLLDIASTYTGLGTSGETVLVTHDEAGNLVHLTPLRFDAHAAFNRPISLTDSHRVEVQALNDRRRDTTDGVDYRGRRVFASTDYIEEADLGLVVKMDRSEVLAPLRRIKKILLGVAFAFVLGVIAAALLMSRSLTGPILRLTRAADLFSRGKLDQRVPVTSSDEIGRLSDSFNEMASSIQNANAVLEEQISARTAELTRSNKDLEQFAYVASHDLQEPLRMVSSYTQLLARRYQGQLGKDADEFIEFAVDGARRMQGLINDLLQYSRIGSQGGKFTRIDSAAALDDALGVLTTAIDEAGAAVEKVNLPEIVADEAQMSQLFQNLVGNAIKYRSEAAPMIRVCAERLRDCWQFEVNDNGIGVDPAFTERIFTIFQRLHSREEYEGSGIGLAISKRIVERRGGTIWMKSKPGIGSSFFFTVPDHLPDTLHREDTHE